MSKQPEEEPLAPDAAPRNMPSEGEADLEGVDAASHADFEETVDALAEDTTQDAEQQATDVETLRAQVREAQERALRLNAELDNFRKRSFRTMEEERKYASVDLMRDLLGVVDNLHRAIDAARENENSSGLLEGVEMVADQLISTLEKHHCTEIPTQGVPFDPNLHEAIAQFPSEEVEPGEISHVTQVGYQLHDRVVRPSQVILAAPKAEE